MKSGNPVVSVIMTTYNHEKYIGEAIDSVLRQDFFDLELVVVNDGSTDATDERIRAYSDERIVYIHQENQGPSAAANRAIATAQGKYIAFMSGDDVCPPERIRRQLEEYARLGRGLLFSKATFIDDDGRPTTSDLYSTNLRDVGGRAAALRSLFDGQCCFFTLTEFVERDILREMGPFDLQMYQYQDVDMLIRLLKKYDFRVTPEPLYHFRIRSGLGNLSAPDPKKIVRTTNEFYLIMRHFFDGFSAELFREAFQDCLVHPDFLSADEFRCEQAFVYLRSPVPLIRLLAVERLHQLLCDPITARVLKDCYNFTPVDYAETLTTIDPTGILPDGLTQLYVDAGSGYNEKQKVTSRFLFEGRKDFRFTFDLTEFSSVRSLRWDPMEGHLCQVKIHSLFYVDASGVRHDLDPEAVSSNGILSLSGAIEFATIDPMFFLPIQGEVSRLTIEGEWEMVTRNTLIQAYQELKQRQSRSNGLFLEQTFSRIRRGARTLRTKGYREVFRKLYRRLL